MTEYTMNHNYELNYEMNYDLKGYSVQMGYMGYVSGQYMLFASEEDYREYLED